MRKNHPADRRGRAGWFRPSATKIRAVESEIAWETAPRRLTFSAAGRIICMFRREHCFQKDGQCLFLYYYLLPHARGRRFYNV